MDSSFSHRQDRAKPDCLPSTYAVARRGAQLTGDGRFTALAQDVWRRTGGQTDEFIPLPFELDNHPAPLPPAAPLPRIYEKLFPRIALARMRREETTLSLSADRGGHFFDTVRDQWGGPKRSDDWFHLHHGDIVMESVHLAGAGLANLQPETLQPCGGGRYRLNGSVAGWTHTLHFRPSAPQIEMSWRWNHAIEVLWHTGPSANQIELELQSDTPQSLAATLWLWIREGVTVEEAGLKARPILAGETVALQGGAPIVLRSSTHAVEIHGLPKSAHRMDIRHTSPIPSVQIQSCGGLSLGLSFPVALRLRLDLVS
jgi:hypothetical protein